MTPIGHFSVGFAVKRFVPAINLGFLLLATWIIDIVFMIFALTGIEGMDNLKSAGSVPSPLSHGLFMALIWTFLTVIITYIITRNKKTSLVIGIVVFSHWILDFIVWSNLPLFFKGSTMLGLGLYDKILFKIPNGTIFTTIIEFGLFIIGVVIYISYIIKKRKIAKAQKNV